MNNVSDLQFTLGNVFFFLKTHTLHNKGGKKIPLFMFWHSKYNHTLQLSQHKLLGGKQISSENFFSFSGLCQPGFVVGGV